MILLTSSLCHFPKYSCFVSTYRKLFNNGTIKGHSAFSKAR